MKSFLLILILIFSTVEPIFAQPDHTLAEGTLNIHMANDHMKPILFALLTDMNLVGQIINQRQDRYDFQDKVFEFNRFVVDNPSKLIFKDGSDPIFQLKPHEPPRTAVTSNLPGDPIFVNQTAINQKGSALELAEAYRTLIHEYSHKQSILNFQEVEWLASKVAEAISSTISFQTVKLKSGRTVKVQWLKIKKTYSRDIYADPIDNKLSLISYSVDGRGAEITQFVIDQSEARNTFQPIYKQQLDEISFDEESRRDISRLFHKDLNPFTEKKMHDVFLEVVGVRAQEIDNSSDIRIILQCRTKLNIDGKARMYVTPYYETVHVDSEVILKVGGRSQKLGQLLSLYSIKQRDVHSHVIPIEMRLEKNQIKAVAYLENSRNFEYLMARLSVDGNIMEFPVEFSALDDKKIQFTLNLPSEKLGFQKLKLLSLISRKKGQRWQTESLPKEEVTIKGQGLKGTSFNLQKIEIVEAPTATEIRANQSDYPTWNFKARAVVKSEREIEEVKLLWETRNVILGHPYLSDHTRFVTGYNSTRSDVEAVVVPKSQIKQVRYGQFVKLEFTFQIRSAVTNSNQTNRPSTVIRKRHEFDSRVYKIKNVAMVNSGYQILSVNTDHEVRVRSETVLCRKVLSVY